MQIVIPMCGRGARFQRAGERSIKPLVQVDGRPMIEHVIALFPPDSDFVFVCASDHLAETPLAEVLGRAAPAGKIVSVAPHKLGPVHSVNQAAPEIRDHLPTLLCYCDFSMEWDHEAFAQRMARSDPAGCIVTYTGFHPHCLGPNLYAYVRHEEGRVLEVREKGSFTSHPMNEQASAGAYYFRSGALLKSSCRRAEDAGLFTHGELYVSVVYNLLVDDALPVLLHEVPFFRQWGTPEDLLEYQGWSDYFGSTPGRTGAPVDHCDVNLMPMAGGGLRFSRAGWATPKPLVPVDGVPMATRALACLPAAQRTVAVAQRAAPETEQRLLAALGSKVEVQWLEGPTPGQAVTCLRAAAELPPETSLLIASCDAAPRYDPAQFLSLTRREDVDCVVWAFRGHPPALRRPEDYGWLETDEDGRIVGVRCKRAPTGDPAQALGITGTFWFRRADRFVRATEALIERGERINGEFYVDAALPIFVEQGGRAVVLPVLHYGSFGTPDELKVYDYWARFFALHPRAPLATGEE